MKRYAAKADDNQPTITKIFRSYGIQVVYTHTAGKGFPDLIVTYNRKDRKVEVKFGDKASFTEAQLQFYSEWRGAPIVVVQNEDDAHKFAQDFTGTQLSCHTK